MGYHPKPCDHASDKHDIIIGLIALIVLASLIILPAIFTLNDIDKRNKAPSTAHAENGIFHASNGMNIVIDSITAFDDYGRIKVGDTVIAINIPIKDVPALKDAIQREVD